MNMSLIELYEQAIEYGYYRDDAAQRITIEAFQQVHDNLVIAQKKSNTPLNRSFHTIIGSRRRPVQGLYLWGDVGRGKTWLMNLFFENLPFENKVRLHFHHFMRSVHERLSELTKQKNPLRSMARDFADEYRVICLDEFIVTNITDAMLLCGLLEALSDFGVTLIATSNRVPDDLYLHGLQRKRFLPTIDLIKQKTQVIHLNSPTDHRLALLEQADVYYSPVTKDTDKQLGQRLQTMAIDDIKMGKVINILNRDIKTIACAEEIVWFDFNALCDAPRAAQDYMEIAREFHTIVLSNVPVMDEHLDDKARRFIYLIDELYDNQVKLIMSSEAQPEALYTGEMLRFAFNRTSSRLKEMRSREYLKKPYIVEE